MAMQQRALRFLFVGGARPWKPLRGQTVPAGEVYELRSMPGNVVACAPTYPEAVTKLQRHLDACFKRTGSPSQWYDQAWAQLSVDERAELCRRWMIVLEEGLPTERGLGFDFVNVSQEPCTV
jgi:hypothetical protein